MTLRMLKSVLVCLAIILGIVILYATWSNKNNKRDVYFYKNGLRQEQLSAITTDYISTKLFSSTAKYKDENLRRGLQEFFGLKDDDTGAVLVDNHALDVRLEKLPRKSEWSTGDEGAPRDMSITWLDLDRQDVEDDELFQKLVVVTAFSENHRLEVMGMIGTVQTRMPGTRIIAYDLGIDPKQLQNVKKLCNVEVRPFRFKKYPAYVSNLMTYAWKITIIKEALNEFGVIFWADASVRFQDSLRSLLPFAKEHHGYLSRIHSYNAFTRTPILHNYYETKRETFDYFGINRTEYAHSTNSPHIAANRQLIINSTTIQNKVIKPLYACALNQSCISPPGAQRGNHMFDASALMLVFYKYLPGEFNRGNDHLSDMDRATRIHRKSDDWKRAKFC